MLAGIKWKKCVTFKVWLTFGLRAAVMCATFSRQSLSKHVNNIQMCVILLSYMQPGPLTLICQLQELIYVDL